MAMPRTGHFLAGTAILHDHFDFDPRRDLVEMRRHVVDSGLLCLIKVLQLVDATGLQLSG